MDELRDKLRAVSLEVEDIPESGNFRLYYRSYQDGEVRSFVYEPLNCVDAVIATAVSRTTDEEAIDLRDGGAEAEPPSSIPSRLTYQYMVKSLDTARQPIRLFSIEMALRKGTPLSVKAPEGWYALTPTRPESRNRVLWGTNARGGTEPSLYIMPGETSLGFELTAPGLPGILTAYVCAPDTNFFPEEVEIGLAREEEFAQTKVVGPVPVPVGLDPLAFSEYLGSLFTQSVELGWVNDVPQTASLRSSLQATQEALVNQRTARARASLSVAIDHVDALSRDGAEDVLTSEAVALLKINAQYLLSKL